MTWLLLVAVILWADPFEAPVPAPAPAERIEPSSRGGMRPVVDLGEFRVTGYGDGPRNGTDGRGITRSGERTRWGAVAVDTDIIPLHSKLLIEGFADTTFEALDTGGAIRGTHIDVWFPSDDEALAWGVQRRRVLLVEDSR